MTRSGNNGFARIQVVSITNDITQDKTVRADSTLIVGESMQFHYFPSEMTETITQNYDIGRNNRSVSSNIKWASPGPRKVKFKAFFNELGDNFGKAQIRKGEEKRNGFLSVPDSIEFLREISTPLIVNKKIISPPLIALFGLLDREIFFGVITALSINVTNWSTFKANIITLNNSLNVPTISNNYSIPSDVKIKGIGYDPIRAMVDIEITSARRTFTNRKGSKKK